MTMAYAHEGETRIVVAEAEAPMEHLTERPGGSDRPEPVWRLPVIAVLFSVAVAAAAGQWVLLALDLRAAEPTDLSSSLISLVLAVFGALVLLRGDSRPYGWLMLVTGTGLGVVVFAGQYSLFAMDAGMPLAETALWIQDLWMVNGMLALLLLPALFPDGTPASPGWRRPVRLAVAAWIALIVVFVLADRPATNFFLEIADPPANPTGILPVPEMAINIGWVTVTVASIVISIGSLVTRWRKAGIELRQRFKWVLYAFGVLLVATALDIANQVAQAGFGIDLGLTYPLNVISAMSVVGLAVALGLAVLRFRLYDVDLIINRTIVYGSLTIVLVSAYVVVVAGVGARLPIENPYLAVVATGIVAVAFAPLRALIQGKVNRLMFGQPHDPYAVLSEMGRVLARSGAPDRILRTLSKTVADSLKLRGVAIELEHAGGWTTRASYGEGLGQGASSVIVPLRHQNETVGRLVVFPREPLSSQDRELLDDIAHQAGAMANSVRLAMALQHSRESLVLTREEERRRIRRDLHDGLGPSLAIQTLQLDDVMERLDRDPRGARELLETLKRQNQQLVADIRRLVYELRPPALDELGVAGALRAHAGQLERSGHLDIQVATIPDPLPALPAAVEVASYRIAREAITNTVRHSRATRCTATLEATGSELLVTVCDDGDGIDQGAEPGLGLVSMRERTEELGGTLTIRRSHPVGTTVLATLPLTEVAPVRQDTSELRSGETEAHHG